MRHGGRRQPRRDRLFGSHGRCRNRRTRIRSRNRPRRVRTRLALLRRRSGGRRRTRPCRHRGGRRREQHDDERHSGEPGDERREPVLDHRRNRQPRGRRRAWISKRRENGVGARRTRRNVRVGGAFSRPAAQRVENGAHGSVPERCAASEAAVDTAAPDVPTANAAPTSRASLCGTTALNRSASRRPLSGSLYAPASTRRQRPRDPRSTSAWNTRKPDVSSHSVNAATSCGVSGSSTGYELTRIVKAVSGGSRRGTVTGSGRVRPSGRAAGSATGTVFTDGTDAITRASNR